MGRNGGKEKSGKRIEELASMQQAVIRRLKHSDKNVSSKHLFMFQCLPSTQVM